MAAKKKPGPGVEDDLVDAESRSAGGSPVGRSDGPVGSYDDWTVKDLRRRAKELGLSGYSGKKKTALVELLRHS